MSFILKKNNLEDPYSYLPDNKTIGTFGYWKRKFGDKFDDLTYLKWDAMSKLEGVEKEEALKNIKAEADDYINRLLAELEERQNENLETTIIEDVKPESNKLSECSE